MSSKQYWARKTKDGNRWQALAEHLDAVCDHMRAICAQMGCPKLGAFIGTFHDMCKAALRWQQERLEKEDGASVPHAPPAALWLWRRFGNKKAEVWTHVDDRLRNLAALIIALVIDGHHSGLHDIVNPASFARIFEEMHADDSALFGDGEAREAALAQWEEDFLAAYPKFADIDAQFEACLGEVAALEKSAVRAVAHMPQATDEQKLFKAHAYSLQLGLAVRFLLSALVDADRYDAYRWEAGLPLAPAVQETPPWKDVLAAFEGNLEAQARAKSKGASDAIAGLRAEISARCRAFARDKGGIYRLTLPTGAGKTYSGFRFALAQAAARSYRRVFMIAPRLSILDQTEDDLRAVLGSEQHRLYAHHSNVVVERAAPNDEALARYELFTERWNTEDIILTSLVHFLGALYGGRMGNVRRMQALANAVIVIDEVQDVPDNSLYLFNAALLFLTNFCNCTVVLCSATQPVLHQVGIPVKLAMPPEIVANYQTLYPAFKRVELHAEEAGKARTFQEVAEFALEKLQGDVQSLLLVANTKPGVQKLARLLHTLRPELKLFRLTTNACAAHRLDIIHAIADTLGREPLICISTSLVEYGVNLSFDCGIRLNCGLDHFVQMSGRVNRHGEARLRASYLLNCSEEPLGKLYAIQHGWQSMENVLSKHAQEDLSTPVMMNAYFKEYFKKREDQFWYPLKDIEYKLVDLLGCHVGAIGAEQEEIRREADRKKEDPKPDGRYQIKQAFRTAGQHYHVIDDEGAVPVVVPYGEKGMEVICALVDANAAGFLPRELRQRAQRYTVSINRFLWNKVGEQIAVFLENIGVYVLKEGYYDDDVGLNLDGQIDPEKLIH
nr:CRISPR-associated endonuclease Cas3'' [Maliibacterium massiliense]